MVSFSLETFSLWEITGKENNYFFVPTAKTDFFVLFCFLCLSALIFESPCWPSTFLWLHRWLQGGITFCKIHARSKICILIENLMSYLCNSQYESTLFYFFNFWLHDDFCNKEKWLKINEKFFKNFHALIGVCAWHRFSKAVKGN